MNRRIRELAEQAYDTVEFNYAPPQKVFNKEKFAELIVQECITRIQGCVVEKHPDHLDDEYIDGYNYGVKKVARQVKYHFGVEE